ncbi:MAG: 3-dehydroquinate synthase, partial [Deltaproteobacteria bacterium]|nr:3-dehydroquinate synthase [Deltaproteobacteria bacterium]
MHILTVNLGDCYYPIDLGEGLHSLTGELLKKAGSGKKVGVVSNQTVADLYLDPVQESLTRSGFRVIPIFVPEGEEHKNLKSLSDIFDRLIGERFDRS